MIKDERAYQILVIEDNPGDFAIVHEMLSDHIANPVIVHAKNFKQAYIELGSDINSFDVILLDLSLPDKSRQSIITEILVMAKSCPVNVLTGNDDIDFSIRSIAQGISDYLIKDNLNGSMLYKSILYSIERKKNISQIQESEKRYSDLFHLSPDPMFVYALDSLLINDANQAAVTHYGFSYQELLSMKITSLAVQETTDVPSKRSPLVTNIFTETQCRHKKKNGELIVVSINENSLIVKGKEMKLLVAKDITERIKYISTIESQNKKFKEIAWIQSHIIRAPLARMMGIVNLIKEVELTKSEFHVMFDHFIESGNELDSIIKEISDKTNIACLN